MTAAATEEGHGVVAWSRVAAASGALVISSGPLLQFSFPVILPRLTATFGVDRAEASIVVAVGMTASGLSTPVVGLLVDRLGSLRVTATAAILLTVLFVMTGLLASSLASLMAYYALIGAVSAAVAPLPFAKTISERFTARRGLALGIAMAGVGLGAALMPLFVTALLAAGGWRDAYLGIAVLLCCVGLPLSAFALSGPRTCAGRGVGSSAAAQGMSAAQALRSRVFWFFAGNFFILAFACNGAIAHLYAMLLDRGLPTAGAVATLSLAGLTLILGRLVTGYLLDRFDPVTVSLVFLSSAAAAMSLLLTTTGFKPAIVAAILIGAGLGAEIDLIAFLISLYFGRAHFAAIYGYFFLVFVTGSALGPIVFGYSLRAGGYGPALATSLVALLVAILQLLRFRTRSRQRAR